MLKVKSKVSFGKESLEYLINEIIQEKIKEVAHKIKNREVVIYNNNYLAANSAKEKVDEIK